MKRLALALLFPASVLAAECVLQDRTVTSSTVRIEERSGLREDVVPAPDGGRRCMVNFKARVGATCVMIESSARATATAQASPRGRSPGQS